jgi:hypothetical protein
MTLFTLKNYHMKKFVVERNFPGASNMSAEELQALSKASNDVIDKIGKSYIWIKSYVTDDKMYCVHIAESEEAIREHASLGKLPVNTISEVKKIIDPINGNPLSQA